MSALVLETDLPPHVLQLAQAVQAAMSPMFEAQSAALIKGLQVSVQELKIGGRAQIPGANKNCGCDGCKDGGSCDVKWHGTCDPFEAVSHIDTLGMYVQGLLQKCRLCRKIDPCIVWMYLEDRRDLDSAAWEQYLAKDGQLVHIDVFAGAGPNYQVFPLPANKKALYTQSTQQVLSFWPEILKVSPDWTGTPMPSKVILRWYTGPKGLTGLTDTSQLVQIGEDQTLSDYSCGDACYVIPFPQVKMCPMGHIPMRRAVYLEIETKAIGAAEVAGINATIIKRGTEMWERWAPLCKKTGCKM